MIFNYFQSEKASHIIDNFYEVYFESKDIPFESRILPTGQSHFIYVETEKPYEITFSKGTFYNKGLIIFGQSFRSYNLKIDNESSNFGISFHPTTLYKLLKEDLSKYTDKHLCLKKVNLKIYETINPIFEKKIKNINKVKLLETALLNLPIYEDKYTKIIDKTIKFIREHNGLITVENILNTINISQKNLEIQFKKIVGLTPGKYIKLYRFFSLMKKYESHEVQLKELIDMYNYYDRSHFIKDFKLFMNQSPKEYFKKNNSLLKKYLKE
ncbi:AraC family transcriptional regulator [uncultured Lacinutrix sp.]|uniref:helix-turn-helix domain-containing protein n=1 Tax=uncultured Lacinutrix sp. TaxID=574032 RepID=UPI00262F95BF|nr:AraC family transcriptional regulator [uncultured Lacinutrix sp.]